LIPEFKIKCNLILQSNKAMQKYPLSRRLSHQVSSPVRSPPSKAIEALSHSMEGRLSLTVSSKLPFSLIALEI
jgi:hypothetical protein